MIVDGDLVAIRSRGTAFDVIASAVQQSPYTHTAVAVWVDFAGTARLLVAESNASGASLAPLSQYADADFDVFECPTDRVEAGRALFDLVGEPIHYDLGDLARIAAHRLLGVPLPARDDANKICSALSGAIYLRAGWRPDGLPSIPAPDDLVRALGCHPKVRVRREASPLAGRRA
jgi:hypothetical protein